MTATLTSFTLTATPLQTVEIPIGSSLAGAYMGLGPRIVFLVDPMIDAYETWDVLLLREGDSDTTSPESWQSAGSVTIPNFGTVHCLARKQ